LIGYILVNYISNHQKPPKIKMNYLLILDTNLVNDMIGVEVENIRNKKIHKKMLSEVNREIYIIRGYGMYDTGECVECNSSWVINALWDYDEDEKTWDRYYLQNDGEFDDDEDFKNSMYEDGILDLYPKY